MSRAVPESYLHDLLGWMPDACLVVGAGGDIVMANALAERLFGYGHGEMLGQPLDLLLPARVRDRHAGQFAGFVEHPKPRSMGSGLDVS
jgi:PAS domain S-box-containing protein